MFLLQLELVQAPQGVLKRPAGKRRPRRPELPGRPIDGVDQFLVERHLHRSHGRERVPILIAIQAMVTVTKPDGQTGAIPVEKGKAPTAEVSQAGAGERSAGCAGTQRA